MAKILLADNDAKFLKSRTEILEKSGYPVVAVNSLDEARKKLRDNHCDLAVIDVRLLDDNDPNDFSGLTLVRELNPDVSVILYSGYIRDEDIKDFSAEGRIVDFLFSKDHEPMLQAIQHAFERKRRQASAIKAQPVPSPSPVRSSQILLFRVLGFISLLTGGIIGVIGTISGNLGLLILLTPLLIVIGGILIIADLMQRDTLASES
ncbi:MAG: response regulator [candidate division KSB1 bacterium]|nr:response regulator [candidate division KSB1 bacterium]MDZ7368698.1 response regulator [candidate division KSB1 bacterium]MDZ7406561.1 response regulator [candidate division KSB1 bacterium]